MIALDDDVRLGILPHSTKFIREGFTNKLSAAIEFKFRRGEILIMHPALIHYGCDYTREDKSLRAHFYFDNPLLTEKVGPQGEHTYLFKHRVQPIMSNKKQILKAKQAGKETEKVIKEANKRAREANEEQTAMRKKMTDLL